MPKKKHDILQHISQFHLLAFIIGFLLKKHGMQVCINQHHSHLLCFYQFSFVIPTACSTFVKRICTTSFLDLRSTSTLVRKS